MREGDGCMLELPAANIFLAERRVCVFVSVEWMVFIKEWAAASIRAAAVVVAAAVTVLR